MENWKEKYGQWALVLGATDGIGKEFVKYFAANKMDVLLVGRRQDALQELGLAIEKEYGVAFQVLVQDLTAADAAQVLIERTRDLDVGIMNFVACSYTMGSYHKIGFDAHQRVLNININNYSALLYHFAGVFAAKKRGGIITMSSLTAFCGNPYNAEYAATKAYMQILTESIAGELKPHGVDVLVITAGSTRTPDWYKNQPAGVSAEDTTGTMSPAEVVLDGMPQLGKSFTHIAGEHNRAAYHHFLSDMTRDETTNMFGGFYSHLA
ncbi:MAG: SDR family NAD(P)-dependent oxidoreductase [Oscillibacter sp.]